MSDGLFFSLIILFFFVVWLAGGGPHRPISFAGPFITPITNTGETQNAYGPGLEGTLSAGGVSVGTHAPAAAAPAHTANGTSAPSAVSTNTGSDDIPNTSAYAGVVSLEHFVSMGGANPQNEYVTLTVSAADTGSVMVTGWKLVSIKTGTQVTLPDGSTMLTLGSVSVSPIILQPGNTVTIITGYSPVNISYEENTCTNLLSNYSNYSHCFAEHASDKNFLTGNWQLYLNQPHTLWQKSDTIELVDQNGKVVDSFSY
jgi:hypothetical protein